MTKLGYVVLNGRRYSILEIKPCECGCGQPIEVTTRNPNRRFVSNAHLSAEFKAARSRRGRLIAAWRRQERLFSKLVDERIRDRKVTRDDLLWLCGECYYRGYQARACLERLYRKKGWTLGDKGARELHAEAKRLVAMKSVQGQGRTQTKVA